MVSTRGTKFKFMVGEKVLCYEPDQTKAKVLYDSKVMAIIEPKDKRGASKRVIQYLIHFQGWNSSWDRRVVEEFVLKDTDENRQLQKDLAEQSQLQIGAYLYRKEHKKRQRHMSGSSSDARPRFRGSSDEGSLCSISGSREMGDEFDENSPPPGNHSSTMQRTPALNSPPHMPIQTPVPMGVEPDTESYSSSVESTTEDDRVYLQIGDLLKTHLELDWTLITKANRLANIPAQIPIITILENYVKHFSIKAITCPSQLETPRRRNSSAKMEKREKDYEKLMNCINLRKEVADGLRIYFNFTIKEYLLYKQEREQAEYFSSPEFTQSFEYVAPELHSLDMLSVVKSEPATSGGISNAELTDSQSSSVEPPVEEKSKRRLRSYKTEESEFIFDIGLPSVAKADNSKSSAVSNSSGSSTAPPHHVTVASLNILRSILPLNIGITSKSKEILQDVLAWQTVPSGTPAEPSMMYGAIHLARLIVKLPDFLNATSVQDDKLKTILKYLDNFIEFLESHPEWFGESHYTDATLPPFGSKPQSPRIPSPAPDRTTPTPTTPPPTVDAAPSINTDLAVDTPAPTATASVAV